MDREGPCALTRPEVCEKGLAIERQRGRATAILPPEGRAKRSRRMSLVGVTGGGTQTRPGSVGGRASWRAPRGRSHESPGKKLHVVAGHFKGPGTESTQLSTVAAVTERTPSSPTTLMGVAKGTMGTPSLVPRLSLSAHKLYARDL